MIIITIRIQEFRIKYNQQHYQRVFNDPESVAALEDSVTSPSLFQLVEVRRRLLFFSVLVKD